MQINIIGGIFDTTGYSIHTRQLANALYKLVDVKLTTPLVQDWNRLINDAELDMILKQHPENCINLIITTPHNWKIYTGLGINIGYCVWEGDKVPKSFISEFLNPNIDLIFVPSKHTADAIFNTLDGDIDEMTIITKKVKIIPHGVNLSKFYKINKVRKDNIFRFVCNKGWRGTDWDRGGVQYVIKAFSEEFRKDEKVELLIKLNPAYINPQIIKQAIDNLKLPENRAPIHVVFDNSYENIRNLYNDSDVFVCATRSEAFNLPGIEAMACGLPTIQTNFGGQTDYMTSKNSLFVDYRLEEVKEDLMYEGINWAVPNIADLRKQMRWVFEHQEDIKEMGKQAEQDSKKWTWELSAEKIVDEINKIYNLK